VFGVLFAIELIIRLVALRCELVMDPLSWIDITSVLFWTLERVFPNLVSFNTMMIRIARLVRLARFIRIVKFVNAFQKLYLLVQSIKSSFSALVWSSAVLCLGEFIIALVINISLADFLRDVDKSELDRLELFKYYGTFTGALLTQFEMLLGNWYTITRALVLHSELWALYGIIHQLILGFAVIEVITGVFLRETFQVASLDDGIMTTEEQRAVRMNTEKLKAFFESADIDGNGQLDELEIKEVLTRNKVQEWLSAMGLEVEEVEDAFHLFDVNGDGEISVEEFVGGALKLRGPARATEVHKLHRTVDKMCTCMGLSQTPENRKLAPPEEFE
jgi:Ca2+-binding EF-hand superfamily protein